MTLLEQSTPVEVAFFSAKAYDRTFFDQAGVELNALTGKGSYNAPNLRINYIENRLFLETVELARGARVVCCFVNDQLDAAVLERLGLYGVQLVAMRCAGYNNIDLKAANANRIAVVRVPAYSPQAVAEHAAFLLGCVNRRLHKAYNRIRDDNYCLDGLVGRDIHGMTIGIIGTGKIGQCFAKIMNGFGVTLLACDICPNSELEQLGVKFVNSPVELFPLCDVISLHCPLFDSTYHMIDAIAIASMKPGCILINTSRGALIDTQALIEGIKSHHLGGAGIDVYENEAEIFFRDLSSIGIHDESLQILKSYPNVVITSHQGFLTETALTTIANVTITNIQMMLSHQPCENIVLA